jgi:transposase
VSSRNARRTRCAAPIRSTLFAWGIEALDIERRRAWNDAKGRRPTRGLARQGRSSGDAHHISQSRYAPWKNPGELTGRQRHQLDWIAKTNPRLWRAYLLKEGLRYVFAVKGLEGKHALDQWIRWARRPRMPAFVQLQRRIVTHRDAIDVALDTRLSQGLIESTNTKIRLLTRIAFGFHGYQPLIALAMLALGSHPPRPPGRN